ncbi:hypothetical protein YB2330_004981 [Saitoella coloradoensis]
MRFGMKIVIGKDLQINERELFASWHARWMEEHGGRREEKPTVINGKLKYGTVAVEFKRMTRMSKGSTESPMPPEQHLELEVPVYDLAQYVDTERLDSRATKHVVFPLGRHEAMKMDLFGDTESEPTAMRLYVEGVNGISGKPVDNTQHKLSFSQGGTQDHVVVPTQPSINGYVAKSNSARQFTQMSLKLGLDTLDSLKETDTSHDLQLEFIPSHGTTGFSFIATNLWSPGKIRQAPQNLDARKSPMEYGITNNKHLSLEHSGRPALLSDLIFTPRDPWDELAGYRENIAHVRASYPSGDFKVTLINMNGKALTVRTPYTYTVTKLKQLIETVHYIPANEQILILEGRRLLDAMYLMDYELNPHSIIELHRQPHIHPDFLPPTPQSPGFPVFPPTRKQSSDDSHTRLRIWKDKNDPGIYDMAAATTVKVYPVHPALFEALTGIKVKGRASLIPVRSSGERRLSEASIENETCCRCYAPVNIHAVTNVSQKC